MKDQLSSLGTGTMATPTPVKTLHIITEKLIPWIESRGVSRIVIAQSPVTSLPQPPEVRFTKRRFRGPAVKLRGPGSDGYIVARWPKDGVHASRFPVFVFVLEGEADFSIGDAVIHCPHDHAILFPPGTPFPARSPSPHWERPDLDQAYSDVFWIICWNSGIVCHQCHSRGEYHQDQVPGQWCFVPGRQLFRIAEMVVHEMCQQRMGFEVVSRAQLLSLFVLLRRHLEQGDALPEQVAVSQSRLGGRRGDFSESGDVVACAKEYIHSHLGEVLTLQDIARAVYTSRPNLTRLFRRETGMSVWEYVTTCRIEEAKSLLKETEISVQEVGRVVGFSAASHFCTRFTHFVGESPAAFRQRQKK